jgi:hypothetical protein
MPNHIGSTLWNKVIVYLCLLFESERTYLRNDSTVSFPLLSTLSLESSISARTPSISMESLISILHLCKKLYYLYMEILWDLQLGVGIFFGIIYFKFL